MTILSAVIMLYSCSADVQPSIPQEKEDGGNLRLLVYEEGEVIETIPLAEWIARMGDNWLKKDLEDIYIGVDYAKAEVSISIKGWDDGYSFKVEI